MLCSRCYEITTFNIRQNESKMAFTGMFIHHPESVQRTSCPLACFYGDSSYCVGVCCSFPDRAVVGLDIERTQKQIPALLLYIYY